MNSLLLGLFILGLSLTKPHYQYPFTYPVTHTIKQTDTRPPQSPQTIITDAPNQTPEPQVLGTSETIPANTPFPTNTPENSPNTLPSPDTTSSPSNTPQPTPNTTSSPQTATSTSTPAPTSTSHPTNNPTPTATSSPAPSQAPKTSNNINQAVNQYRNEHNLPKLNTLNQLCQIAQQRAQEITDDFSHSGFDPAVKTSGIDYQSISENIWWGTNLNLENTINDWHESSSHRDALQGDWTHGCGAIKENHVAFLFLKQ